MTYDIILAWSAVAFAFAVLMWALVRVVTR